MVTGASVGGSRYHGTKTHARKKHLAKQKLESVGTLAGGIAHDFNNLLGGILAHSELALAELASGSRPEEELERIRAVAIRGAEIVRQLMIYAGQESEVLELVDVSAIVEDMLELLKVSVSKHAAVETDLGKDLPAVRANPAQIRQVVMNLITNASEAIGDRDGVIRVTTGRVTVGRDSPAGDLGTPGRGRLRATGGLRHRPRHDTRNASQGFRPVLHDQTRGPRPRACGRPRDRSESRWDNPSCERTGRRVQRFRYCCLVPKRAAQAGPA